MATLYLIPTFLAPGSHNHIAPITLEIIRANKVFVVERIRTARRFIRALDPDFPIDEAIFVELDKHNFASSLDSINQILHSNQSFGFLSEAGSPCIADPGARIVNMARAAGYRIRPISGPSSILLGLMASGMNGQQFTFHGYLPIKKPALADRLKEISHGALTENETHLFIETPYRNAQLLQHIRKYVHEQLYLSIGIDLTGIDEKVITKSIKQWNGTELGKQPCIFSIGKLSLIPTKP